MIVRRYIREQIEKFPESSLGVGLFIIDIPEICQPALVLIYDCTID